MLDDVGSDNIWTLNDHDSHNVSSIHIHTRSFKFVLARQNFGREITLSRNNCLSKDRKGGKAKALPIRIYDTSERVSPGFVRTELPSHKLPKKSLSPLQVWRDGGVVLCWVQEQGSAVALVQCRQGCHLFSGRGAHAQWRPGATQL